MTNNINRDSASENLAADAGCIRISPVLTIRLSAWIWSFVIKIKCLFPVPRIFYIVNVGADRFLSSPNIVSNFLRGRSGKIEATDIIKTFVPLTM